MKRERKIQIMEEYLDITVPISQDLAVMAGDPPVSIKSFSSIRGGDSCNILSLNISTHTGTHVDAPLHFFQNGRPVDEIYLGAMLGKVRVVALRGQKSVTKKMLQECDLEDCSRLIIKTDHSYMTDRFTRFRSNFVYLETDACGYLVEKGFKLVGIDSFSVDKYQDENHMCHKILLGAGIVIVEVLDLKGIEPGDYDLCCLPLKILKGDGAPARVILKSNDSDAN